MTRKSMLLMLVSGIAWAQAGPGPEIQHPVTGHYYATIPVQFDMVTDTWLGAELVAQANGGHLVTINTEEENDWIVQTFAPLVLGDNVYIGFNDRDVEGTFVWTSGEDVTYTNWNGGEPNNAGGIEDVTELNLNSGGWNDNSKNNLSVSIMERIQLEFKTQPTGPAFVEEGTELTLSVEVWGNTGTVTYQWQKDGVDLSGETSNTLVFPSLQTSDDGTYQVVVSDESKSTITSSPRTLYVVPLASLSASGGITLATIALAIAAAAIFMLTRRAQNN